MDALIVCDEFVTLNHSQLLSMSTSSQTIVTKSFLDHPLRAGSARKRQNQASSQTAPTGLVIRHFSPIINCHVSLDVKSPAKS